MKNYDKYMETFLMLYEAFKKGNLVIRFYEKSVDRLIYKWLYIFLPFAVFCGEIFIMMQNNVLYSVKDEFAYINDFSNSIGLSVLFFVSYYLSGYFSNIFKECLNVGIKQNYLVNNQIKLIEKEKYFKYMPVITFIFGVLIGFYFYNATSVNTTAFWIKNLSVFGKVYYCIFLGITWSNSISLLGMSLIGGLYIFLCIKTNKINYILYDYNMNISIMKIFDVLICTFSYGLFYIIGSILFILNDRVAVKKYEIYNVFSQDLPSLILVIFVLLCVTIAYIPLQELFLFVKDKKKQLIDNLEKLIKQENDLNKKNILKEKRN